MGGNHKACDWQRASHYNDQALAIVPHGAQLHALDRRDQSGSRLGETHQPIVLGPKARCLSPAAMARQGKGDSFEQWCRDVLLRNGSVPTDERVILLMGQTGSGKSSFLNLLCNLPAVIRHGAAASTGKVQDFHNLKFETDVQDRTVSQTGAATTYRLEMGRLRLLIVDTPGFGDTRGQEFDKKHTKMIVDCLKTLGAVHAVTLVISGREARMTTQLKYVLTEVCAILPQTARDNIFVIFTNTASPLYLTFDISVVSQLVEHQVRPERLIFIANPYVLWERSVQNRGKVDDVAVKAALVRAFQEAAHSLSNFFAQLACLQRLNTHDFQALVACVLLQTKQLWGHAFVCFVQVAWHSDLVLDLAAPQVSLSCSF